MYLEGIAVQLAESKLWIWIVRADRLTTTIISIFIWMRNIKVFFQWLFKKLIERKIQIKRREMTAKTKAQVKGGLDARSNLFPIFKPGGNVIKLFFQEVYIPQN